MDRGRIAAYAAANDGVVPRVFLESVGVSTRCAREMVRRGELRRRFSTVYVAASAPVTFMQEARAVCAEMPTAVLAVRSAAALQWGTPEPDRVEVIVPPGGRNRLDGVDVHQFELDLGHITRRRSLAVTSIERTVLDLAMVTSVRDLRSTIESLLLDNRTRIERLELAMVPLRRQYRQNATRLAAALDEIDGRPPTESELESLFLDLLVDAGLPLPQTQHQFNWQTGDRGRVDCWFPDASLIVELDGRRYHARVEAFERDRRREQLAALDGVRTIRITHRQLADDPSWVLHVVRSLCSLQPSG